MIEKVSQLPSKQGNVQTYLRKEMSEQARKEANKRAAKTYLKAVYLAAIQLRWCYGFQICTLRLMEDLANKPTTVATAE